MGMLRIMLIKRRVAQHYIHLAALLVLERHQSIGPEQELGLGRAAYLIVIQREIGVRLERMDIEITAVYRCERVRPGRQRIGGDAQISRGLLDAGAELLGRIFHDGNRLVASEHGNVRGTCHGAFPEVFPIPFSIDESRGISSTGLLVLAVNCSRHCHEQYRSGCDFLDCHDCVILY